ncbi:uncharacterized protein LOC108681512 isoform X2 [Hyalella azteca]|uniref:Uncharacterized protein LOC108681512 isoform X2 n=1 Tax=Hyalella azteca TaxID=294128 RepID=A0A8B7PKY5_HYAAZ|nr:uncharacterized protein LOC108681512 isoform X2 [Hyalella azteca]
MRLRKEKQRLGLLLVLEVICALIVEVHAIAEEIEATPTNTNGVELGEVSMAQFILLLFVFLKLTLLYSVGILPLEIDLGGLWDPASGSVFGSHKSSSASSAAPSEVEVGRSFDGYHAKYDETVSQNHLLRSVMWDCPLQFVCEVDHWANRDHEFLIESMIAKWLRNPSNHTFHSTQGQVFGGLPETCPAMYPCPFDVQKAVGITIPGSARAVRNDVDHSDPDSYLSLF